MNSHEKFILALNAKKKLELHYHDETGEELVKNKCIPIDYCDYIKEDGKESGICFRFWDCDAGEIFDKDLKDEQIDNLRILDEDYDIYEYKGKGFCNVWCIVALFVLLAITILIIALIKFI